MSEIGTVPETDGVGAAPYRFRLGPFAFDSEIDIAELRGVSGSGHLPVSIRLGGVPAELAEGQAFGRLCQVTPSEYLLRIPDVGRFHVSSGQTVRVELVDGAPQSDVSLFLMGSVFGALCHQNGLLPLHASAVEAGGAVTAFLGESGAGKSTLAACLQGRGLNVVSDDICVLEPTANAESMRVVPVAGWLKLWRASFEHLGATPDERNRVHSANDKYRIYLDANGEKRPRLTNLVFLSKAATADAQPRLEPMTAGETIAHMLRLTYLGYITHLTGSHERIFRQCGQVLERARGYRLVAPWGFDRMDAVLELLEREILWPSETQAVSGIRLAALARRPEDRPPSPLKVLKSSKEST